MKTNDESGSIKKSFVIRRHDDALTLSETRRLINLSFTLLTAITLILSIGVAISINASWEVKKENAVLREAIHRIDPFIINDAEIYISENTFLID